MHNGVHIRVDREFLKIMRYIKAKYYLLGKKPPSDREITKIIASKIDKERLVENEFNP